MPTHFFPLVWDSTQLAEARSCEIRAFRRYIQHFNAPESIDLIAGGAFAHGIHKGRNAFYVDGNPNYIEVGIDSLVEEYGDFYDPWKPAKSVGRMALALESYFNQYDLRFDDVQPLKLEDGSFAVEYSLLSPILDMQGNPILHPTLGLPLLFSGRLDMLASYAGGIYIVDEKTTGSYFSRSWAQQWETRGQFTGYCLTPEHEVLTKNGWIKFPELEKGVEIACYDNGVISYSIPLEYIEQEFDGELYSIEGKTSIIGTPNHRQIVWNNWTKEFNTFTLETLPKNSGSIRMISAGKLINPEGLNTNPDFLRLIVAIQADGHINKEGNIKFSFKKVRKINRLHKLLLSLNIPYTVTYPADGTTAIVIKDKETLNDVDDWLGESKTFPTWVYNLTEASLSAFFNELQYWDGTTTAKGMMYFTSNLANVEVVRTVAALCGWYSSVHYQPIVKETHKPGARVVFSQTTQHSIHLHTKSKITYKGKVYCVRTTTGYFVVRHNDKISITGNSWLGKQSGIKELQNINGAIVRGICLPTSTATNEDTKQKFYSNIESIKHQQAITARSQYEVDNWERDMVRTVQYMLTQYTAYLEHGEKEPEKFFSGNWGSSCTDYGKGCPLIDTCKSANGERFLEGSYEQYIWLPTEHKRRPLKEYLQELNQMTTIEESLYE